MNWSRPSLFVKMKRPTRFTIGFGRHPDAAIEPHSLKRTPTNVTVRFIRARISHGRGVGAEFLGPKWRFSSIHKGTDFSTPDVPLFDFYRDQSGKAFYVINADCVDAQ